MCVIRSRGQAWRAAASRWVSSPTQPLDTDSVVTFYCTLYRTTLFTRLPCYRQNIRNCFYPRQIRSMILMRYFQGQFLATRHFCERSLKKSKHESLGVHVLTLMLGGTQVQLLANRPLLLLNTGDWVWFSSTAVCYVRSKKPVADSMRNESHRHEDRPHHLPRT